MAYLNTVLMLINIKLNDNVESLELIHCEAIKVFIRLKHFHSRPEVLLAFQLGHECSKNCESNSIRKDGD